MPDDTLKNPPAFLKELQDKWGKPPAKTSTTNANGQQDVKQKKSHLAPIKHRQTDFFIADLFTALSFRCDITSMELPLFALKGGDLKEKKWSQNGLNISIVPSVRGHATIHDKDIWIYAISKLITAINAGEPVSKTVRFTIYDYLVTTNRDTGGHDYDKAVDSLKRLKGTAITITHENKDLRIAMGVGLIDKWTVVEKKDGRMVRVEITLPDWLYTSIIEARVRKISNDYFRLRKPLVRRIYEIACKHCGEQEFWLISLELLHTRTGSTALLRNFKIAIKELVESDDLPDYSVSFDNKKNQVLFKSRNFSIKKTKKILKNLTKKG